MPEPIWDCRKREPLRNRTWLWDGLRGDSRDPRTFSWEPKQVPICQAMETSVLDSVRGSRSPTIIPSCWPMTVIGGFCRVISRVAPIRWLNWELVSIPILPQPAMRWMSRETSGWMEGSQSVDPSLVRLQTARQSISAVVDSISVVVSSHWSEMEARICVRVKSW